MTQRIVYLSWPAGEITGGIKLVFRHVEALREAGLEAIIATPDAQPPGWLETHAPVVALDEVQRGEDMLVFPENHSGLLRDFTAWPNQKYVFCQNPYMVYRGLAGRTSYSEFGVAGVLCYTRGSADFCRRRSPDTPIFMVPAFLDQRLFRLQRVKRLQIVFAPRKRPLEAAFIRDMFRAKYPSFRHIPWVELAGAREEQVARALRDSAVYLSLSRLEAVAFSILEAFACGCVVAGFTGVGAREYATDRNGFWAEEDDCIGCVDLLAHAVRRASEGGPLHQDMLKAAYATAGHYSRDRAVPRLVAFWKDALARTTRRSDRVT